MLQVGNTHFTVGQNQVQDAQPGGIGTSQKNLCTEVYIKVF
jgi:hypothetical protein